MADDTARGKIASDLPPMPARRRRRPAFTRPSMVLAVAAGGALGAPARYGVGLLVEAPAGTFPWATFWINVSGSFVLGALLVLVIERWPPTRFVRPFFGTGFLGAYTTWSTFMVETDRVLAHGHSAIAIAYVAASLIGGLAAVYAGVWAMRLVPTRRELAR